METATGQTIRRLHAEVLDPLKRVFVGKDIIVDLLGIGLVAGENLFLLGPPGTAKSAIVHELAERMDGKAFEYLLTRFTEPNELFGPFDIRKLREGVLETNIEGMLPEASFIFLDELLNANSAILNSLLTVLNERVLRRGREVLRLPFLMAVGASNHLPEDDSLRALYDRFLMRVRSDNVADETLAEVLRRGWELETRTADDEPAERLSIEQIHALRRRVGGVNLDPVRADYAALVARLRRIGIPISDRRAVKVQRLIAASAILCERDEAHLSDLWVMEHTWDVEEQRELLRSAVRELIDAAGPAGDAKAHPRSRKPEAPDAEDLLKEIESIREEAARGVTHALRDRLSAVDGRVQWVPSDESRKFLAGKVAEAWELMEQSR